jgi:serine/threonine protein kinase
MPLSIGDKLGHYEVLSLLGQGGMGEVYKATNAGGTSSVATIPPTRFAASQYWRAAKIKPQKHLLGLILRQSRS